MAKTFRKKPIVIEAVKFYGDLPSYHEIAGFLGYMPECTLGESTQIPQIMTIRIMGSDQKAEICDWIIKGIQGEFYPCKPDIFEATYEEVVE